MQFLALEQNISATYASGSNSLVPSTLVRLILYNSFELLLRPLTTNDLGLDAGFLTKLSKNKRECTSSSLSLIMNKITLQANLPSLYLLYRNILSEEHSLRIQRRQKPG